MVLPKPIRDALGWDAGTRLAVVFTSDGVLLKPESSFAETDPEEVFGCLPFDGAPKSLLEMEAGVMAEAARRHARHNSGARPQIASVPGASSGRER